MVRAWQGREILLYALTALPLGLATSMEFSLRPYHAYDTTMVRPCHVGEDRTTLLICSVGANHVYARSK